MLGREIFNCDGEVVGLWEDLEKHQRLVVAESGALEWKVSNPSLLHLREIEEEKRVIGSEMKMILVKCLRILYVFLCSSISVIEDFACM